MSAFFPSRLPMALSSRGFTASAALYAAQGKNPDCAIAGMPFRYATNVETPMTVDSDDMRKEQFDNENEPGEQSLTSWWRRSQDSFHQGAGALYQESRDEAKSVARFKESRNVDVWTNGEVKLLKAPVESTVAGTLARASLWLSASDTYGVCFVDGNTVVTIPTLEATTTTAQRNMGKPVADAVISGGNYYALAQDGTLEFGVANGAGLVTTTWTMTSIGTARSMRFALQRLFVIGGNKIYQPNLSGSGATAALFAHPAAGWAYTDIADGPSAAYFSGHDNRSSSIQMITIDSNGAIPSLSGARVACILPDGELIQRISVLAGQFIGIGTNLGFRMGVLNDDGSITYGPRFLDPDEVLECTALTTMGRFFVVGFRYSTGAAVIYRVDTSQEIADGEFAYATDVEFVGSGYMNSLGTYGDRVFGTHNTGKYEYQHATNLCTDGYLKVGRIRFRTNEPKLFRFFDAEIEPLHGQIKVDGFEQTGTQFPLITLSVQNEIMLQPVQFPSDLGPQKQIALKFTLSRSATDPTLGPVLNSYLVRALPAVKPRRVFQLPLMCWDFELDRQGNVYGKDGYGSFRLNFLQAVEDDGDYVLYQDYSGLEPTGRAVQVDNIRFVMTSPPAGFSGWGGIVMITLKTVD